MDTTPTHRFLHAFEAWQRATADLSSVWQEGGAKPDVFGNTYPRYLPSFDEFSSDVTDMDPYRKPKPNLPALPAVGSIVRARYDLDMGGHGTWQRGWTGEIVDIDEDYQGASIRAHRYLGPGLHQWDNAREISLEDAMGLEGRWWSKTEVAPGEEFADAYAYCATRTTPTTSPYEGYRAYHPTPRQYRVVCALIRSL